MPYVGGTSVALSLLFDMYAGRIKINDIDRSIYVFWYSAVKETDALCRMIAEVPCAGKIAASVGRQSLTAERCGWSVKG